MPTKYVAIECQECGAIVPIEKGRKSMFCSHCGSKISVSTEHKSLKPSEPKSLSKKDYKNRGKYIGWLIFSGIAIIVTAISIFDLVTNDEPILGLFGIAAILFSLTFALAIVAAKTGNRDNNVDDSDLIRLSDEAISYHDEHYNKMWNIYWNLGFRNIYLKNAQDLTFGIFNKPSAVFDITIDKAAPSKSKRYNFDSRVVIKYHDFPEEV